MPLENGLHPVRGRLGPVLGTLGLIGLVLAVGVFGRHAIIDSIYHGWVGAVVGRILEDPGSRPREYWEALLQGLVASSVVFLAVCLFAIGMLRLGTRACFVLLGAIVAAYALLGHPVLRVLHDRGGLVWYTHIIERLLERSLSLGTHPLEEYQQRSDLFFVQVVGLGLTLQAARFIARERTRVLLLAINLALLLLVFAGLEIYLGQEAAQQRFGSVQYEGRNARLNAEHRKHENRFGFTDRERTLRKAPGVFRIVVLGDSYVWGDGVELEDIWSHVLESSLTAQYGDAVEVVSWGGKGWSTEQQLEFLESEGRDFDMDMVIIGFVTNDPDVRGFTPALRGLPAWDKVVRRLCPLFKNSVRFLCLRVNHLLYSLPYFRHWGYRNWEDGLYTAENLRPYEWILQRLQVALTRRGAAFFFVTLPSAYDPSLTTKYERVFALLRRNGIPYLDLLPEVQRQFGDYSPERVRRELWASPVNGHPGPRLSHLYAEQVLNCLREQRLLPNSAPAANGARPPLEGHGSSSSQGFAAP